MINIKITFSYNGVFFNGSATQLHRNTVHDILYKSLSSFGFTQKLIISGRTDKLVHALNQVANIFIPNLWSDKLDILQNQLNKQLKYIYIKNIVIVDENFHARFSATKRIYRYIISTDNVNVFNRDYVTYIDEKFINENVLKNAITLFEGTFDFEYFMIRSEDIYKSSVRTIYKTKFYKHKNYYIFYFNANSYLRKQIRFMVGFLLQISKGILSCDDLVMQLNKERLIYKKPAMPNGLYLSKIIY
jgi:tRNA pseudouridine38-40 synthase